MNSEEITIEIPLAPKELLGKLKEVTVEDFDMIRDNPHANYYGEITSHSFSIKHVRYGPMSHAPFMQGDILEGVSDRSIVKLKMDIKEPFMLVRKMYYNTLLPVGVIVMLLSLMVMGGTQYQWHSLLLSSSFIVVAFLVVALEKAALISTKKKEIKAFISLMDGQLATVTSSLHFNPSPVEADGITVRY